MTLASEDAAGFLARSRNWLSGALNRYWLRKRIAFELSLLSDRNLIDIGLWRSDVGAFARHASRGNPAETLAQALYGDLGAIWLRLRGEGRLSPRTVR